MAKNIAMIAAIDRIWGQKHKLLLHPPMTWAEFPTNQWVQLKIHLLLDSGWGLQEENLSLPKREGRKRDLIMAISGCMKVRMRAAEPRTGWGFSMMKLWKTMNYKRITTKPCSLRFPRLSRHTWSYGHPPSSIATRTTPAIVAAQTITINSRCHWEANNFAKMVHMKLLTMVMGSSKNPFVISFSPGTIVPYHSMNLISKCLWNT